MTEPYSDSEYGPRSVSATLHTKPDRADTIEVSPGRRDRLAIFSNTTGAVGHGVRSARRRPRPDKHGRQEFKRGMPWRSPTDSALGYATAGFVRTVITAVTSGPDELLACWPWSTSYFRCAQETGVDS